MKYIVLYYELVYVLVNYIHFKNSLSECIWDTMPVCMLFGYMVHIFLEYWVVSSEQTVGKVLSFLLYFCLIFQFPAFYIHAQRDFRLRFIFHHDLLIQLCNENMATAHYALSTSHFFFCIDVHWNISFYCHANQGEHYTLIYSTPHMFSNFEVLSNEY